MRSLNQALHYVTQSFKRGPGVKAKCTIVIAAASTPTQETIVRGLILADLCPIVFGRYYFRGIWEFIVHVLKAI